jgi:hypothetical protein
LFWRRRHSRLHAEAVERRLSLVKRAAGWARIALRPRPDARLLALCCSLGSMQGGESNTEMPARADAEAGHKGLDVWAGTAPLFASDLGHGCGYTATSAHCMQRTFHSVRVAGATSMKSGFSSKALPENFAWHLCCRKYPAGGLKVDGVCDLQLCPPPQPSPAAQGREQEMVPVAHE